MRHSKQRYWRLALLGLTGFVGIWTLVALSSGQSVTRVPHLHEALRSLYGLAASGQLLVAIGASLGRVIVGFTIAAVSAIFIAALSSQWKLVNDLVRPPHIFFRYVPATAFISVMIFYFGLGERFQYAVIFISVYFFIFQMTSDAIGNIDYRLVDLARTSGYKERALLTSVVLPAIGPNIMDIIRVNIAGAWTFVVFAEMIGAPSGLGRLIANAQRFGNVDVIFAVILVFGIIGLGTDALLALLKRLLFPWAFPK